jgi:protein phosphatase
MNINRANISVAGESNIGTSRSHNEDNFLIVEPPGGDAVLCAIADGIGGHGHGEIASRICIRELGKAVMQYDSSSWDEKFLLDALNRANARIFECNYAERRPRPMGCTVIAVIFTCDKLITAFAGDSRLYEYDPDKKEPLRQLSTDHRPRRQEGRFYGLKDELSNFVCRSLGTQKHVVVEQRTFPRAAQAHYLLCSDGLYSAVPDQMLAGMLNSGLPVRKMTGKLMCEALLGGAKDNITLICAGSREEK